MVLDNNGEQTILKGLTNGSKFKMLTTKEWHQECQEGAYCAIAQIMQIKEVEWETPLVVQRLLDQYEEGFEELSGLPPTRQLDHKILLLSGANLVNIRLYTPMNKGMRLSNN